MQLTSPITRVPKIGPKYEKLLKNLDISTVEDLLYHFPFRYDDYSVIKSIDDLKLNDVVTIKGTLESVKNIFTKNRKKLTRAVISDGTGKIIITWFNMHYIAKNLKVGERYAVSGKVGNFSSKLCFISPDIEPEDRGINTGRLIPVYPETAGVRSKWLRTRNNDVLSVLGGRDFEEFLPEEIIEKNNFCSLETGLKKFHFPKKMSEVNDAKKRFAFEEMFLELLKVEERKRAWQEKFDGISFTSSSEFEEKIDAVINSLPFELSTSQKQAILEIKKDVGGKHPMNRLLEGDVGSGKTIVAVLSAYLAYLNGYKTLYMAPTEILATQHFETFCEILGDFGVNISLKTGSNKKFDQDADIIIGTHALIYLETAIKGIGLIVIDEQQRFGVEQRTKLMKLGTQKKVPHLLTMTATPIPRTLALTLYGDLAISSLKAPENKPKNIKTRVLGENKRTEMFEWVANQNVPTFVVCPLIEESEHELFTNVRAAQVEFEKLKKGLFKNRKVGLLHGRMKSLEKQKAVDAFKTGKIDVLVSTPVIEVGIDIPDATIIVIESAERFGLASLHQLRGRVGRAGQKAYCAIFYNEKSGTVGYSPQNRLKYLETMHNGLELAEKDMEMRGQGNIYGTEQHGNVKFKVADLTDFELLKKAKKAAEKYFPKLNEYKPLQNKLKYMKVKLVSQN